MATSLFQSLKPSTSYFDKKLEQQGITKEIYGKKLEISTTVYVGNLSIYTTEESIYELFSRCGEIKQIQIGINKNKGTPIGFCFVEYFTHENASYAVESISLTKLDNRVIRVDWDIGFEDGRQYGRGKGGIQVRDAYRKEQDPERPETFQQHPNKNNYQNNNYNKKSGGYHNNNSNNNNQHNNNYKKNYNNNYNNNSNNQDNKNRKYYNNNNSSNNNGNSNNNNQSYNNRNNQNYNKNSSWSQGQKSQNYNKNYNNNDKYDDKYDDYKRKKQKND